MARRISVRVVQNRRALDAVREGFVAGMEAVGRAVLEQTKPLDDPTTPERIIGDYGVWADGKKVAGTAQKPRAAKVKTGVTLLVGFPFPMRFGEMGTIRQPARPRFTPVLVEVVPGSGRYLKIAVQQRTAGVR